MPLTKKKALELYQAIMNNPSKPSGRASLGLNLPKEHATYADLQATLINVRKANLDRDSVEISFEGKPVRVFPTGRENIKIDVDDIFARGIDSARAVTEILNSADPKDDSSGQIGHGLQHKSGNHQAKDNLIALIANFQKNMQHHQQRSNLDAANQELKRFNGALSDLLVKKEVVANRVQGNKAINFVRDFLWKKDMCTANCIIENAPNENSSKVLRYADPMTFGPAEYKKTDATTPLEFWTKDQPWFSKLAGAVSDEQHPWFDKFFDDHLVDLKKLSSTPMSRYTPNPANAFDCSDVWIKTGQEGANVVRISNHHRAAITEPLDVGTTESRQEVTDWNHLNMVNKSRLKSELNSFMEKWGPLFDKDATIPFTMLHQTLVGDEVTFSPDQQKAKASKIGGSVIDSKLEANAAVRDLLSDSVLIREKATGNIEFLAKKAYEGKYPTGTPEGWQEVKIDLLETNNCINMWNNIARVRNNDVNDARQLITNAVTIFKKVEPDAAKNEGEQAAEKAAKDNLNTVIDFLNSADHSLFTAYKFRGKKVKNAIEELTAELKKEENEGAFKHLPKYTRENLALSLQAAVELKCTVHETWGGALQRNIANFTRDYFRQVPILGHLADWAVRGTMGILGLGAKILASIVTLPQTLPQMYKHRRDRQEICKATYEGMLAETIGALHGGCMSSADRASEMAEQRVAHGKQFDAEGKILSYNDNAEEKVDFYKHYARSEAKHRFVQIATGTPVTSDIETRGLFQVGLVSAISETPAEQALANRYSSLRKGNFDKHSTCEAYKEASPFGVAVGQASPKVGVGSVVIHSTLPLASQDAPLYHVTEVVQEDRDNRIKPS